MRSFLHKCAGHVQTGDATNGKVFPLCLLKYIHVYMFTPGSDMEETASTNEHDERTEREQRQRHAVKQAGPNGDLH